MTSKRLIGYAKERGYPFLCIHAGEKTETRTDGSVRYVYGGDLEGSVWRFDLQANLRRVLAQAAAAVGAELVKLGVQLPADAAFSTSHSGLVERPAPGGGGDPLPRGPPRAPRRVHPPGPPRPAGRPSRTPNSPAFFRRHD